VSGSAAPQEKGRCGVLSFRLRLADTQGSGWRWDTDRWVLGESWIRPAHATVLNAELSPGHGTTGESTTVTASVEVLDWLTTKGPSAS
jgi:hypothetical protein